MGQKVHPHGFRLGFNKTWRSRWFADKDYAKLLHEDLKLRDTLKTRFEHALLFFGPEVTVIRNRVRQRRQRFAELRFGLIGGAHPRIEEVDTMPRLRGKLRDPRAHRAGADDADLRLLR